MASRYSAAEQEVEDLQDEILGGIASDPNFLPEVVLKWSFRGRCEAHQVMDYLNEALKKWKVL